MKSFSKNGRGPSDSAMYKNFEDYDEFNDAGSDYYHDKELERLDGSEDIFQRIEIAMTNRMFRAAFESGQKSEVPAERLYGRYIVLKSFGEISDPYSFMNAVASRTGSSFNIFCRKHLGEMKVAIERSKELRVEQFVWDMYRFSNVDLRLKPELKAK